MGDQTVINGNTIFKIFYEIDTNNTKSITGKELIAYLEKHDASNKEIQNVQQKLNLFDSNKNNEIEFGEFVNMLGYEIAEAPPRQKEHISGVDVISANMPEPLQYQCVDLVLEALERSGNNKDAAKNIKALLDKRFDKLWHCIIAKGQYWAHYSHEPEYSFVFKYDGMIYVFFRTPY